MRIRIPSTWPYKQYLFVSLSTAKPYSCLGLEVSSMWTSKEDPDASSTVDSSESSATTRRDLAGASQRMPQQQSAAASQGARRLQIEKPWVLGTEALGLGPVAMGAMNLPSYKCQKSIKNIVEHQVYKNYMIPFAKLYCFYIVFIIYFVDFEVIRTPPKLSYN